MKAWLDLNLEDDLESDVPVKITLTGHMEDGHFVCYLQGQRREINPFLLQDVSEIKVLRELTNPSAVVIEV